jgi:hypothetical protein
MTDWSKKQLGPIPPVARGGRMDLAQIIGADDVKEIEDLFVTVSAKQRKFEFWQLGSQHTTAFGPLPIP